MQVDDHNVSAMSVSSSSARHLPAAAQSQGGISAVQLDDQLSLVKFLRHANSFKDEQIQGLQAELARHENVASAEMAEAVGSLEGELEQATHVLRLRDLDVQRLEGGLRAYRALEPEIDTLRSEVDQLQAQLARERRQHEVQLRDVKEDFFQYRGALEREFSEMTTAQHSHHHSSARSSMEGTDESHSDTASSVGLEGVSLAEELSEAQHSADAHVQRYQHIESQHSKLKIEFKVVQEGMEAQTKKAVKYKRQLAAAEAKFARYDKLIEKQKLALASATAAGGGSIDGGGLRPESAVSGATVDSVFLACVACRAA